MRKNKPKLKANLKKLLRGKVVLITGGAGSVGSNLMYKLLDYPIKSVRVLDIDEHSLFLLGRSITDPRLRLLLGNVLDKDRIMIAGNDVDIIFHTAAIKNIEISEFNPIETIDTNINGAVNLLKMVVHNKPEKFVNISTDKAADPTTLYGATKQLSERLTGWAGHHISSTKFCTVRFGNIFETRGNVFEVWENEAKNNQPLSITNPSMNRYFFHLDEAVDFILDCLQYMNRGEIFIPKMKSYNIKKLAEKFSKKHRIIGLRQGEKMEEILISEAEKRNAQEKKNMWIVKPYTFYKSKKQLSKKLDNVKK